MRRFSQELVGKRDFRSQPCHQGVPLPLPRHPGQHVQAGGSQGRCQSEAETSLPALQASSFALFCRLLAEKAASRVKSK